ncbi:MAG TPA: hypothetical protein VLX92_27020 [Kofleriaceae bacterium]|nr:hypothetical protein [Kofleriaceae bacterium]
MRALAAVLLVGVFASDAHPMVVEDPELVRECPGPRQGWEDMQKCLTDRGKTEVLATLDHARVVHVQRGLDDLGIALYVEHGDQWTLGGLYQPNAPAELFDAMPFELDGHHGFRLDLGVVNHTVTSRDGQTSFPVVQQEHYVMLCPGTSYDCAVIRLSCDVIYQGKTLDTFRGQLQISNGRLHVSGDRRAATSCAPSPDFDISWRSAS